MKIFLEFASLASLGHPAKYFGTDSIERLKQDKREKDVLNKISADLRSLPSSPDESSLAYKPNTRQLVSIPITPTPEDEKVANSRHQYRFTGIGIFSIGGPVLLFAAIRDVF